MIHGFLTSIEYNAGNGSKDGTIRRIAEWIKKRRRSKRQVGLVEQIEVFTSRYSAAEKEGIQETEMEKREAPEYMGCWDRVAGVDGQFRHDDNHATMDVSGSRG